MTAPRTFELTIQVPDTDVDPQRHVNNVAFLRYVQEIAIAHWRSIAPEDVQSAVTWVVRRHEIEYLRPGLPNDELLVRTWVGEPSGATWERFTEISRRSDSQLLVKARTVWVLLDAATGRGHRQAFFRRVPRRQRAERSREGRRDREQIDQGRFASQ
jgi:acyl-CoA thioester hydrolase